MTTGRTSAVIAGGGIGGLATALALARGGIASHVCERRAVFPEEGAGIQIGPNGVRILRALGVADLLQDRVATPDALSVRDGPTGQPKSDRYEMFLKPRLFRVNECDRPMASVT